jgi:hypothetical protein
MMQRRSVSVWIYFFFLSGAKKRVMAWSSMHNVRQSAEHTRYVIHMDTLRVFSQ